MSKDNITNYGKSIRSKLLNVAKKEDVFYQTVLTRYFQERLLYRMSQTRYRDNFYLKGGALLYAFERFAARPTLDIDFLGHNISNEGNIVIAAFREICSVPYEEDGIIFDIEHITAQNITEFKDYHGIRLSIPVQMDTISQVMTMDIGFGDVVTPSPVCLEYPLLLEHLPVPKLILDATLDLFRVKTNLFCTKNRRNKSESIGLICIFANKMNRMDRMSLKEMPAFYTDSVSS